MKSIFLALSLLLLLSPHDALSQGETCQYDYIQNKCNCQIAGFLGECGSESNVSHMGLELSSKVASSLRGYVATNVTFIGSDLSNVDFTGATLDNCNFQNANFSGAKFEHTAFLQGDFVGAIFSGASIRKYTDFTGAVFDSSIWIGTKFQSGLTKTKLAQFEGASFRDALIQDVTFRVASFKDVDFSNAFISFVDFSGINLNNSFWNGTKVIQGMFAASNLSQSHSSGDMSIFASEFPGATLDQAVWPQTTWCDSTINKLASKKSSLSSTDLSFNDFGSLQFSTPQSLGAPGKTKFKKVDIKGAVLHDARFIAYDAKNIKNWETNTKWYNAHVLMNVPPNVLLTNVGFKFPFSQAKAFGSGANSLGMKADLKWVVDDIDPLSNSIQDISDVCKSLPSSPTFKPIQSSFVLENEALRMHFDLNEKQLEIGRIEHAPSGKSLDTSGNPLWSMVLREAENFRTSTTITGSSTYCTETPEKYLSNNSLSQTLILRWRECQPSPLNGFPASDSVDFYLTVRLPHSSSVAELYFWVYNNTGKYGVMRVDYDFSVKGIDDGDRFLFPTNSAAVIFDPTHTKAGSGVTTWSNNSQQHLQVVQLEAFYNVGLGIGRYLATMDETATHLRLRAWDGGMGTLNSRIGHFGDKVAEPADFAAPYKTALGVFEGDWYDAAQIYRKWAVTSPIVKQGKLADRADVPLAWKEVALTFLERHHPIYFLQPLPVTGRSYLDIYSAARNYYLPPNEFPSSPMATAFFWNWYYDKYEQGQWTYVGSHSFFDGWGSYIPVVEAAQFFPQLQSVGVSPFGYTNSFSIGVNSPSFQELAPYIHYASGGQPNIDDKIAVMGSFYDAWHTHMAANSAEMATNSMIGQYLDFPFQGGDYNPDAPHDAWGNGGTYVREGYQKLVKKVLEEARKVNPNYGAFSEQGFEAAIPVTTALNNTGVLDSLPNDYLVGGENVPLIETLYSSYALQLLANPISNIINLATCEYFFPNVMGCGQQVAGAPQIQADWAKGLAALSGSLMRGFSWGRAVTASEFLAPVSGVALHENQDPFVQRYVKTIKDLIRMRLSIAKKYLIYGQLLRELPIVTPEETYLLHPEANTFLPPYEHKIPRVVNSVFKASDGGIGIFFGNHTSSTETITWKFNPNSDDYNLPPGPLKLYKLDLAPGKPLSSTKFVLVGTDPLQSQSLNLQGGEAVFFELRP